MLGPHQVLVLVPIVKCPSALIVTPLLLCAHVPTNAPSAGGVVVGGTVVAVVATVVVGATTVAVEGVGTASGAKDATADTLLEVVLVEAVSLPMKKAPTASTRTTVPIPICR